MCVCVCVCVCVPVLYPKYNHEHSPAEMDQENREELRQLMHKSKNEQSESWASAVCFSIM